MAVKTLEGMFGKGFGGIITKNAKKTHKHSTKCKCHKKKK